MLSWLWSWLRRHYVIVDGVGAAGLLCLALLSVAQQGVSGKAHAWYVLLPLALGLCVPLAWRRHRPVAAFAVIAATAFAQWAFDVNLWLPDLAVLPAAYSVAAQSRRRLWAVLAFVTLEAGAVLLSARWVSGLKDMVFTAVMISAVNVAAVLLGDSVHSRRAYYAELEERADRLEREREREAQLAVAAERSRIAREMHDVVAHNVSVMVVQAQGAAYLLDLDPERSRAALETVTVTGRQALAEMRRLLGVLRDEERGGERAPQPGVGDLPDLVERLAAAGLPVDLAVAGGPVTLPPGQGLVAYRVVQEALTNVLKHAGPAARASVRVERTPAGLSVVVRDDGRGAGADPTDGAGHGLRGMRERLAVYGGTLRAGPLVGGGFEVAATIPADAGAPGPAGPVGSGGPVGTPGPPRGTGPVPRPGVPA